MADGEDLDQEHVILDDAKYPIVPNAIAPLTRAVRRQPLAMRPRVFAALQVLADPRGDEPRIKLYELRNALARYKDLRNVAKMHGYEWLYDRFDVGKAQELLHEVSNRIQMINNKEALALKDMAVGDTVYKYGVDIGKVVAPVKAGEHAHVHNIKTKRW